MLVNSFSSLIMENTVKYVVKYMCKTHNVTIVTFHDV